MSNGGLKLSTESQKKASKKYSRKNTKRYAIELNIKTDSDIIKVLDSVSNKQGYIKELIKKDIYKEEKKGV